MWLTFIIYGTLLALIIWIFQRNYWPWMLKTLLIAIITAIFFVAIYLNKDEVTLNFIYWYNKTPYKEIILFIIMLKGMVIRYITKMIEDRQEKIKELKKTSKAFNKPQLEFDIWEFSYPLFISIVTYGMLLQQLESNTITISNMILSFQTGFFWQTLLKKSSSP